MVSAWECGHPACKFGGIFAKRSIGFISFVFLNRENTKTFEFHEIFEALAKLMKSVFTFSPQAWGELEGC